MYGQGDSYITPKTLFAVGRGFTKSVIYPFKHLLQICINKYLQQEVQSAIFDTLKCVQQISNKDKQSKTRCAGIIQNAVK